MQSEKENEFAFGNKIFFGTRIDHLIYTIYKNNEKFIDFNDAQNNFEFLFCSRNSKGWHIDNVSTNFITSSYYMKFRAREENIDKLKIFIRHNIFKNENVFRFDHTPYGYIWDIDTLRKRGRVEIDVKKNNDKTGFKYKLTDCKGNLISYAIDDQSQNESSELDEYLNGRYERNNLKNFLKRFNLGLNNGSVVLSDNVKGFCFTDYHVRNKELVCLGTKTKLTFTKKFLNELKGDEESNEKFLEESKKNMKIFLDKIKNSKKSNNKFYVLPKSQALRDIVDFILLTKCLPFESLSLINKEIVKSYDTEKFIEDNLDGQDMTTLRVDDIKIDPNLKSNKFYDDLDKLCQIDDGYKCAVALIDLLSKIQAPNSNFKYKLNSVKDGKPILKTMDIFKPDISQTLVQTQNNTETKTSWLEEIKAKALESQYSYSPSENINGNNEPAK